MENARPDPRGAFMVSISGLQMGGYGEKVPGVQHGTEVPNNIFDIMTDISSAIKAGDHDRMDDLHSQLVTLSDKMRMSRTDLGTRVQFLTRTEEQLTNNIDRMSELESHLISSDPAEEAINTKMAEYVWLATLQLGNQILPKSLLDFLR
jgi:flagellin-like hook-associated protein FlgL